MSSSALTIAAIEQTLLEIVEFLEVNQYPVLTRLTTNLLTGQVKKSCINLKVIKSRKKFAVVMKILARAYQLLQNGMTLTRRDLYYEDKSFYLSQAVVNFAIRDIAKILQIPISSLPFESSVKGVMAFNNSAFLFWTDVVGNQIPTDWSVDWGKFESNIEFVLIVEKDAIFHRLQEEGIFDKFGPFILITGKGYPDAATRTFCSKLSTDLSIPTFALVDSNPHGLEIAAIYKWGSDLQRDLPNGNAGMVVPDLILLGFLPSDFDMLAIPESKFEPLTARDKRKLTSLARRIEVHRQLSLPVEPIWQEEISIMEASQKKAEIEALTALGPEYLLNVYLCSKINAHFRQYSQFDNYFEFE